ncbi:MAG TPA: hypothetical protein H9663_02560 [Firmicutes bacterium]|nr:hypothetical protein [Bacillota bacterium]
MVRREAEQRIEGTFPPNSKNFYFFAEDKMAKKWQKVATVATSAVLACSLVVGMTACNKGEQPYEIEKRASTGWEDEREYTYNTYTAQLPAVWTQLNTKDAADMEIISYINSSFYEYDYAYDENGEIVPGGFEVEYSAATDLEDVTAKYAGRYGIPEDATAGKAFAITLRNDLKWDDGTPIHAEDFVYTMSQQLSPNYLFAEASNYYSGNYIIHNAQNYVYQGQENVPTSCMVVAGSQYQTVVADSDGVLHRDTVDGATIYVALTAASDWSTKPLTAYVQAGYIEGDDADLILSLAEEVNEDGAVPMTEELQSVLDEFCRTYGGGYDNEWQEFCFYYYTYPKMDFSEVGFFVGENENELVIVVDGALYPLDENGDLAYGAAYYLESFPLVKRDLWEKLENRTTTPWTNTYGTAKVENIASWGPYKLTEYQSGVTYTLERNEEWYGYGLEQYALQYQTDRIVTRYVAEWNTAWQSFQLGQFDGISLDPTIISDYRNSQRAYFTPSTATACLYLNSIEETYEKGKNIMLKYDAFREAISLSLDREDFCAQCSPSSLASLGYLNDMYYYDVEHGGVYRETDQAKTAILKAYGAVENEDGSWTVGSVTYDDIDEAEAAITGYNVTLAREKMTEAYEAAKAAGDYTDGDPIVLTYGITEQSASVERQRTFYQNAFNAATEGTPLEGKITIEYFMMSDANWDKEFMDGKYDIASAGWQNAPFDPFYLLGSSQIGSDRFQKGWDPDTVTLTLDVKGGEGQQSFEDLTMTLTEWNECLQALSGCRYDFKNYPIETKLEILAAEETAVLQTYWGIPVRSVYEGSLMSYKVDYINYEYNTFMGYGGVRYMSYNFDDTEWAAFVAEKGTLNYTF